MNSSSMSQRSDNVKSRSQYNRRSWTMKEEQQLIVGLKEIVSRGWKADNGFKTGYLGLLEHHMSQAFPGTDLKADPHINSKIHVWKKQYGSLSTMLTRSGFGLNDSANIIEVIDDQVWNEYIRSDANARTMRYKAWSFYKDWLVIFRKDVATGESVEACMDAINELFRNDKGKRHMSFGSDHAAVGDTPNDSAESDFASVCGDENDLGRNTTKKTSKKRSRFTNEMDPNVVKMMSSFFDKAKSHLGEMVAKIGFEHDVSAARKKVFDTLSPMVHLSVEDTFKVASRIFDKNKDLDLFFSVSDDNKEVLVNMILEGRF